MDNKCDKKPEVNRKQLATKMMAWRLSALSQEYYQVISPPETTIRVVDG